MTVFQFILAALCCYRITVCFARDAGPFGLFKKLRGVKRIGPLFGCPYCISIWVAVVIEAGFFFSGYRDALIVMLCIVFALSAISIGLDRILTSDHQA